MSSTTNFTIEDIREIFKNKDCILLESVYRNQSQPLRYICSCGLETTITFKAFQKKKKGCIGKHATELTHEFVANFFKEQGCELLEIYKDCMTPMKYKCSCGSIPETGVRWNDFKDGTRCNNCKGKRLTETRDKNQSHWAITGNYSPPTNQVELTCEICNKKYNVPKCLEESSRFCGMNCKIEWHRRNAVAPVLTDEMKKKISETAKKNGSHKGPNNSNWKGGITTINEQIRKCDKYKEWSIQVYRKDNWTCQGCGRNTNMVKLEAHHKKSFSKIRNENNIKTLEDALNCIELWDVANGVSYCHDCHSELHNNYNVRKKGKIRKNL